jgi:hypothetical protein
LTILTFWNAGRIASGAAISLSIRTLGEGVSTKVRRTFFLRNDKS